MKISFKKQWIARLAAGCAAVLTALGGAVQYYAHRLPDHYYTETDRPLSIAAVLPVTVSGKEPSVPYAQEAELRLFGIVPVKTVSLTTVEPTRVTVGGEPFGIRMLMDGVMVVSLSEVGTPGGLICPARNAGIEVGDIIKAVNGVPIAGNADLQAAVGASAGAPVTVTLLRGENEHSLSVQPVFGSQSQRWQTGMWVRDSTAGIGTVTYYTVSPSGRVQFAGLGHAVCDADTGEQIPLASGDVISVSVDHVIAGTAGKPGELRGQFDTAQSIGTLLANTGSGVFGIMGAPPQKQLVLPLGFRQDIRRGKAEIYTTLNGTEPVAYEAEIEEIRGDDMSMRDLIVHVTDERLLKESGGIVQGMSGSPIVQNGRLIGAVTHVFVKDPTRGYGIFAENMYAQTAALAAG